jgi:chaperonin GroES
MINKMHPIGENILVKPDEPDTTTAGGIIIAANKTSTTGTVVAVGPGKYVDGTLVPTQVKPSHRVMYAPVEVTESLRMLKLNGVEYLLMLESQIFGIIEEGE